MLALPRVASYRAVWASIDAMTWLYALATTPGGLGITEIGLIGILADGAGDKASA